MIKTFNVSGNSHIDGAWKYFQIERHQRHKKTTATNNDKCRKIRDKKVQKYQNFSLSCLYLSKFVTVVSHCLSNFLLSFIFDCSFFPRPRISLDIPVSFFLFPWYFRGTPNNFHATCVSDRLPTLDRQKKLLKTAADNKKFI